MKVYALYTGCRFEGGSVSEIYAEKESAIKFALMLVEKENNDIKRKHDNDEWEYDDEEWEYKEQSAQGMVIKCWQNPIDEIIVYEYELK